MKIVEDNTKEKLFDTKIDGYNGKFKTNSNK